MKLKDARDERLRLSMLDQSLRRQLRRVETLRSELADALLIVSEKLAENEHAFREAVAGMSLADVVEAVNHDA